MQNKINLIYILSNGRSGSTILDLMLGSFDHIWTLGEAQLLELELRVDAVCGSGEKIVESIFWKDLISQLELRNEVTSVAHFRCTSPRKHGDTTQASHVGKVIRWRLLRDILNKKDFSKEEVVKVYNELNRSYYEKTSQHAINRGFSKQVDWVVDASKDPYRLVWLQASEHFNIKVIHLVKHPCSFVYSTSRTTAYEGRVSFLKVIRMTGRWLIENGIMNSVLEKYFDEKNFYTLKYEDLARNPKKMMIELSEKLGISTESYIDNQFRDEANFAISGNKSRWENRVIRLDERWKTKMPVIYQNLVKTVLSSFMKKYKYK